MSTGKMLLRRSSPPPLDHWWLLRRENSGAMEALSSSAEETPLTDSKLAVMGAWAGIELACRIQVSTGLK